MAPIDVVGTTYALIPGVGIQPKNLIPSRECVRIRQFMHRTARRASILCALWFSNVNPTVMGRLEAW